MADSQLTASATITGRQIDLTATWSAPASEPRSLRINRRRWGYPAGPEDGRAVLDLADLFTETAVAGVPWGAIDRTQFLLDNPHAEGGGLQAELVAYYAAAADPQPKQVMIRMAGGAGGALQSWLLSSVSRATRTIGTSASFKDVVTIAIFAQPSGGAETLAGTVVVSSEGVAPGAVTMVVDYSQTAGDGNSPVTNAMPAAGPNRLDWMPAGAAENTVFFASSDLQTTCPMVRSELPTRISFITSLVDPGKGRGALPLAVTDATSGSPIAIQTAAAHGLVTGSWISITGATGNTAANGTWSITVPAGDTDSFTLDGSSGNGAYTGGGVVFQPIIRTVDFAETSNIVTGQLDRSVVIRDREPSVGPAAGLPLGLLAGTTYYYAGFQDTGSGLVPASIGTASALATESFQFADKLYALLPAVHRFYDDPESGMQGSWQLRRFVGIFGPMLDQARSLTEALPSAFDVLTTRAEYLPYLANAIGWQIDRTAQTERQRSDILFAPEVYATIGTSPNIQALANRSTGWTCQVKEFVNNVFLTNAVEPVRLWQLFEAARSAPASGFGPPSLQANIYPVATEPFVTQADPTEVDARPAAIAGSDGKVWLFWHSTRLGSEWQPGTTYASGPMASIIAPLAAPGLHFECTTAGVSANAEPAFPTIAGATVTDGTAVWTCRGKGIARRRIWLQRPGVDSTPVNVVKDLADGPALFDEAPTVVSLAGNIWLAWASNRSGGNEIWLRSWSGAPASPSPARQLTHKNGDNRNPALLCAGAANAPMTAFWQSTQAGQTAIWSSASSDGGATWTSPGPVSPGPLDRTPAAVIDASNQVRLFWSADRGVSSQIRQCILSGPTSTVSDVTDLVPGVHDEAPFAVLWNGVVQLFWHSNRSAQTCEIWSSSGPDFNVQSTAFARTSNDKQPSAIVEADGSLHLFFTSQATGARYRSRTYDSSPTSADGRTQIANQAAKAAMGGYADRLHYTYDTRRTTSGVIARDTVGLFLTPNDGQTDAQHLAATTQLRAFLTPFRPISSRLVYFVKQSGGSFAALEVDP